MKQNNSKICLVSIFFHQAFFIPFSNIRNIVLSIYPKSTVIVLISPELVHQVEFDFKSDTIIIYKSHNNVFFRIMKFILLNLKISWNVFQKSKDVDSFLFFSETGMLLPMVIGKLCNKKIFWLLPSSLKNNVKHHSTNFFDRCFLPLQVFSYNIVDNIILYSKNLIKEWDLEQFKPKILIANRHFVNLTKFTITTPFADRPFLIGYIGRLNVEKGIQNFTQALPTLLANQLNLQVLIGGDGQLKESIETSLKAEKISDRVDLIGWIAYDDLPQYLNQLRLLVIPSYTEGLPNIMLEAIACGTPVLATPVGAIPDIIRDGETGFIMEDNSPECIARNVRRALNSPELERIAENGKLLIENEFTFEITVNRWKQMFEEIR